MADNKVIRNLLITDYGRQCMLTGVKYNLTYHHTITKRVDTRTTKNKIKGETLENGSLLTERIHCYYLHSVIEKNCPLCFNEINLLLQRYKEAIDTGDLHYITWHNENVVPVFSKQLNKSKRRTRK